MTLHLRAYRPGDEDGILQVLAVCHPERWGDKTAAYWRWKHRDRPGFRPEDVVVVTDGELIVGCFHQGELPMTVAPGLVVAMSFDGDFALLPRYRGRDLARRFFERTDPDLLARAVAARGGFTSVALNQRLYAKRFGYVFVPSVTTSYRRLLSPAALQRRLDRLNEVIRGDAGIQRVLARYPTIVALEIDGLSPGHLILDPTGINVAEGPAHTPHVHLRLPYPILAAAADGPIPFLRAVTAGVLRGRARLRGWGRVLRMAMPMTVALARSRAPRDPRGAEAGEAAAPPRRHTGAG